MRVITGTLGGQVFDSPGTAKTHPMSEKMCGALFNILGDIAGLTVLDAFAGTGALSFEAVSRGATQAIAVEADATAARTIRKNIEKLHTANVVSIVQANVAGWMQTNPRSLFDLVLCDPPYDNTQPHLISKLVSYVRSGGLLVLSWPAGMQEPDLQPLQKIEQRAYGDAQLIFYRG